MHCGCGLYLRRVHRDLRSGSAFFKIGDREHTYENKTLYVSKIFKWFAEDFNNDIIGFFLKYAEKELKKELEAKGDQIKIKYLHYDWSLNGK